MMVGFGGNQAQAALPAGTHAFDVHLAAGSGKEVTVSQLSPAPSQCLTSVTVGTWQPAPSRPRIPATPAAARATGACPAPARRRAHPPLSAGPAARRGASARAARVERWPGRRGGEGRPGRLGGEGWPGRRARSASRLPRPA